MPTIRDVVQALAQRQGVKAAIVLGRDGLPIDSASHNGLDPDGVAAVVPPIVAACGKFESGVVEFDGGMALVTSVTPDALVALIVGAQTNIGALLYEIRKHRGAIARLL
jgi:predicted regulator of Ras-like GTPase activity (Roadblock/LC7/MglB family)